jgi:tRNA dimethylallyltransferase
LRGGSGEHKTIRQLKKMNGMRIVLIVGPTASGKSALALRVAEAAGGEIVSADSQQVYRGMDIGTGKVGAAERARVRHHLLDVIPASETMTAARFAELADAAIADAAARGRPVIVAGGTGLYVRALMFGLFAGPGADAALRAQLEAEGAPALHARLARVDPAAAARIGVADLRRLVRALEVHALTGEPMSVHQDRHDVRRAAPRYDARWIGLCPARAELVARIDARVAAMVAAGLVDEVRALIDAGVPAAARAFDAIGYREVRALLQGSLPAAELVPRIQAATRQYARRQLGWFRSEPAALAWYTSGDDVDVNALAAWLRAGGS